MFVFSKNQIKTFNPIKDRKNKQYGKRISGTNVDASGKIRRMSCYGDIIKEYGQRFNIWKVSSEKQEGHPAPYPEKLAEDHIISWSNKGDLILDPFMGSGTTAKMALKNERDFIGFEISQEYVDIANKRIAPWKEQTRLF